MDNRHFELSRQTKDEIQESGTSRCTLVTYVLDKWQVTTCYRESSAMESSSWYYETFVWLLPERKDQKRVLIADATEWGHSAAIQHLLNNDGWVEPEDNA